MLDGQLVHFPGLELHYAKEINVLRIDKLIFVIGKNPIISVQKFTSWLGGEMTAVRWKIFRFHALISHERQKENPLCGKYHARSILGE